MLLGGQSIGPYKVVKPLGAGGFGAVFLAEDTRLGKPVALKVPHKQGAEGEEMLREPKLMAALNHPNIVQIYTVEHIGELFFMVMEFAEGGSLHDYITEKLTLEESEAVEFGLQILAALDYAHERRVLHRDVRPSNVLVGAGKILKLTDFGTSRYLRTGAQAATRVGSPPYMAPEHFEARTVFASDLYSVGVILYEMVTGQLPVFDVNPVKIYELIVQGRITPVNLKNQKLSREYGEITARAMAPHLSDRYQNAREMIRDLETLKRRLAMPPRERAVDETRARIQATAYGQAAPKRTPPEAPRVEAPARAKSRSCWNCHKPVPMSSVTCPACGEKL